VKEEEIVFMMNNSFHDTLDNIFSENFEELKREEINELSRSVPIFCFVQNPNKFYIYMITSTTDTNNSWIELNKTESIKIFNKSARNSPNKA
jgi:hypothetical protein